MLTFGVNGALKRSKVSLTKMMTLTVSMKKAFFVCKKNQTLVADLGWIERHDSSKPELLFSVAITNKPTGMKCSHPKMYSDAA